MNLWQDARALNALANALLGATLIAALAAGAWWVAQRPFFTLGHVRIDAAQGHDLQRVSPAQLRSAVTRRVNGNFFAVDLDAVRAVFESVPWVRRAGVRRVWPDGLEVSIEEHRALALWDDGRVVNTFGELFVANLAEAEDDGELPQFSGPEGTAQQVARRYAELREAVAALDAQPQALSLSARHAWTLRLDDGTTLLLGRDQGIPVERRVARWVETWPIVVSALNRRAEVIDLRYPNGFAIRSLARLERDDGAETLDPAAHGARPSARSERRHGLR
ncbi:MAG: cell division protein FtsQ/DivIB [Burkholderiaceae bacterium]|nr:cell division protein FtsQ/DivIB [Burkholderiaceae bacterium]